MAVYVAVALAKRKTPDLAHGVELLISACGFFGSLKMCWLVFSGELSRLIEARPPEVMTSISPGDVVYFAVGGIALGWLALETIMKHFARL